MIFNLDEWESLALARVPEGVEVLNALRPQKNFRYPEFPPFALGEELEPAARRSEIARVFRVFAYPPNPNSVHIYRTLPIAVEDWLRCQNLTKTPLGLLRPAPAEFLAAAEACECPVTFLPRDPEDLFEALQKAPELKAILISQPSRVDGFYYPDEAYNELIKKILAQTQALVLSEESNHLFTLNEIPPGAVQARGRCFGLRSLTPAWSPHGPSISWWFGEGEAPTSTVELLPLEELQLATRALMAFQAKQGESFSEFQRKILVVDKGLRGFADALKPALQAGHCRIPLWPESGFHMLIEIKSPWSSRELCLRFAERHGLIFAPGEAFGAEGCVQICFAGLPNWLERLGTRLTQALNEL